LINCVQAPQALMQAIVCSNTTRKDFAASEILKRIKAKGIEVIICEPTYKEAKFFNSRELFRRD